MCKLFVGIKENNQGNKKFKDLFAAQMESLCEEKDGIAAVTIKHNNKISIMRELIDYDKVFHQFFKQLNEAKFAAIHSRTGTQGNKSIENVHFFEDNGYIMAQNGFVPAYMPMTTQKEWFTGEDDDISKEEKELQKIETCYSRCPSCQKMKGGEFCDKHKSMKVRRDKLVEQIYQTGGLTGSYKNTDTKPESPFCDTFQFLKNLEKPITKEILNEAAIRTYFSGMGLIIEKSTARMWFMIFKDCKAIIQKKEFVVYSSYEPNMDMITVRTTDAFGVPIILECGEKTIRNKIYDIQRGIYEIDLVKIHE